MKAKILLFAAAVALCSGLAFGMAKNRQLAQIEGVVEFYGNAPFPRLGLKTNDGTLYFLDAEKGEKDALGALHGFRVRVEGTLTDAMPPVEMIGATVLKVEKWRKL